jgi:hypothetical protein
MRLVSQCGARAELLCCPVARPPARPHFFSFRFLAQKPGLVGAAQQQDQKPGLEREKEGGEERERAAACLLV